MPFPEIDPIALQLGPVAIRWYALAYIVGILFGWWYTRVLIARPALWLARRSPLGPMQVNDLVVWMVIGIIVGGRLGYVLFYRPDMVLGNPLEILAVWHGGMSFHGGVIGVCVMMALFSWRQDVGFRTLGDCIVPALPIGLFFGRCANFVNGELWGRVTDVPWGVVFPGAGPFPRHPSQLYEAGLEGIVLFMVLRTMTHRLIALRFPGLVSGAFLAGYGVARIAGEFFREPDRHIGFLPGSETVDFLFGGATLGMVLSVPMIVAGVILMAMSGRR